MTRRDAAVERGQSNEASARLRAASAVHDGVDANHAVDRGEVPANGPRRAGRGHRASFGEDRVCARNGCETRLSRYNRKALCSVHESDRDRHPAG